MRKFLVTTIAVFLILHQINNGIAVDVLGTASSIIGLCQFFVDVYHKIQPENMVFDKTLIQINELSNNVLNDTRRILNDMKNLRSVIRHEFKTESLEQHFAFILEVFQEALVKKSRVDNGRIYRNNSEYRFFASKGKDLDRSIAEITRMLTDEQVGFALSQNFMGNLNRFEDTCRTGKSDFQLLDTLLTNIRFTTAQYFWTRKFMYDFLELIGEDNTYPKEDLLKDVSSHYAKVAEVFQRAMANASTEVWKCDPYSGYDDSKRFSNDPDLNFGEIRAFSKYIASEEYLVGSAGICKNQCHRLEKIEHCYQYDNICTKSRGCSGKLVGCHKLTNHWYEVNVCLNNDKNSHNRYLSVVPTWQYLHCDAKDTSQLKLTSIKSSSGLTSDRCDYCQCICENSFQQGGIYHGFFIDIVPVKSDVDSNKIITGARLVVVPYEDNYRDGQILRVQIEQAVLLGNGTVAKKSWKPLTPTKNYQSQSIMRITWETQRRFYLSPVLIDEDQVLTGLALQPRTLGSDSIHGLSPDAERDIVLNVFSNKVNFITGELIITEPSPHFNKKPLTKSYQVSNADVPTRARYENNVRSSDDQYVDLTVTALDKDGGQSTVPFIDSQKWSANGPLAGASLYVRGQPGYGGFLAIKLYTFNTRKYISTETTLYTREGHYSDLIANFYYNRTSKN